MKLLKYGVFTNYEFPNHAFCADDTSVTLAQATKSVAECVVTVAA
jgi:hypothetical protein